ncbi:ATP-binding protein [Ramlibacter humi]|uniref:ORC1/DEAH AAA+ ATPase domain-containing protein n=1 Tax=Ramlibacter humi TaxID=2530451 RepID=A0A4Z0C1G9_9BURK|nr:AAA family ATPase [Ramlibacter humi]TFZ04079.1 hypothetical protein EZ216_10620 [Ramlibacter humi]
MGKDQAQVPDFSTGQPGAPEDLEALRLFGAPALRQPAGTLQGLEWSRGLALLTYVACEQGWHAREQLAMVLRPDTEAATARNYLRGIIHKLRQALPGLEALRIEEGRIRWAGTSDVIEFRQAVSRSDWQRAVNLQPLPLLDRMGSVGIPFLDEWIERERVHLRSALRRSLLALILQRQAAGGGADDLMRRLIGDDPLDEDAVQFVLSQARNSVERQLAATAFRALQRGLAADAGEEPLASTVRLYEEMLHRADRRREAARPAGEPAGTEAVWKAGPPAAPAPEADVRDAIPLGRADDFRKLVDLVRRDGVRMITVSGFGGVGKTVLARSLFTWLSRESGGSCIWVDLAAAETQQAMLNAIAQEAGLSKLEQSVEGHLALWLSERSVVLFLDNVEQLALHAAVLSRLLRAAPALRIVATSREVLHLPEEYSFHVTGLDFNGPRSPAARLFALHAERVGFQLDAAHERDVVRLVGFLEGLPLAIELAAGWLPLFGPDTVLRELQDNPSFLDETVEPVGSGHTMRPVLATAWRRLVPQEQQALGRLAVFEGAIGLGQAREVAGTELATLLRLVQKSVLQRIDGSSFRLHPLLREFVRITAPADAISQGMESHCSHFLGRLSSMPPLRPSWDMPEAAREILVQAEDLVKAWRHAVDTQRIDLMGPALANLSVLLHTGSRREEALALCQHAQGRVPFVPIGAGLATLHAMTLLSLGRLEQARRIAQGALAQGAQGRAKVWLEICLSRLDWIAGDYRQSFAHAKSALETAEENHPDMKLMVLQDMAMTRYALRQFEQGRAEAMESLQLARAQRDQAWQGRALCALGVLCSASGSPAQAVRYLLQSLDHFQRPEAAYDQGFALRCLSYAYGLAGEFEAQTAAAESAMATFRSAGYYHELGPSLVSIGFAQQSVGEVAQARETYLQVLEMSRRDRNVSNMVRCIWLIGLLSIPHDRANALLFTVFARGHEALRPPDDTIIDRELRAAGFTQEEIDQGIAAACALDIEAVCARIFADAAVAPRSRPAA